MKKQLLDTIQLINKVNEFLKHEDVNFDSDDVLNTFESSRERLSKFIEELKHADLDDRNKVNKLMVHIELEYSNFVWAFQEIRDFINRTVVKYPD